MTRHQLRGPQGLGLLHEEIEFYVIVAGEAGIWSASSSIFVQEVLDDVGMELLLEVQHIVGDVQNMADAAGIFDFLGRSAASESAGHARQELECHPDRLIASLGYHSCGD